MKLICHDGNSINIEVKFFPDRQELQYRVIGRTVSNHYWSYDADTEAEGLSLLAEAIANENRNLGR